MTRSRDYVLSGAAPGPSVFERQQSRETRDLEWADDWLHDPALLVRQPGARVLSQRAKRVLLTLAVLLGSLPFVAEYLQGSTP